VLGLIAAYFGTGALLRRSGAVSLSDLIATRFPTLSRFAIIAFVAAICAFLVACSGYDLALRGLMAATGLGRAAAALVLFVVLGFLVVTGGLSTVLWAAVETMIIVVVGLMLPLVLDLVNGQPLALPVIGDPDLWASAETSLAATLGGAPNDHASTFSLVVTFAVGLATLAPLLGPTIAGSRAAEFARTGFIAFAWLGVLALFVCAAAAAATLSLDTAVVGHPPARVPAAILAANARGSVTLCGGAAADSAALQRDCAKRQGYTGRLRLADIRVMPAFLVEGGTKLRHLGPVIAGLADSLLVGLGVALAAAGFQSFVTSIGHDALAAERRRHISTSLRLAFSRGLAILAIGAVGLLLTFKAADTGTMLSLELFSSAAVIAPVMGLLIWPRAK
jgi:Na+(H+)/acetate symporter ActP